MNHGFIKLIKMNQWLENNSLIFLVNIHFIGFFTYILMQIYDIIKSVNKY